MTYLIPITVLALAQALAPVPRRAPDSGGGANHEVQKKTSNDQVPATPSNPPVNTNASPNSSAAGFEQRTDKAENPVIVGGLPPVSIAKDWVDWGIWVFSLLLVVVGALQVVVLIRQAGLMGRHAEHLESLAIAAGSNADAARLNAQATVNAERPWLMIEIGQDESGQGTHVLRAWNRGKTPAEMSEGLFGFGVHAPTGFVPAESMMGPFVAPIQTLTMTGESFKIETMHPHNFLNEHRTNSTELLYAYGKILYWDTFTDRSQRSATPSVTQWCLTYDSGRKIWYRTANGYSKNT